MIVEKQVVRIFQNNEKFKKFIVFILSKYFLNDDDLKFSMIKDISIATGLNNSKVTKLIKD